MGSMVTEQAAKTERAGLASDELADFDTLTGRYQRELMAHCYRMSGSVHEAEDLVQETFLRAWKASASFQGRSSVRTWLYKIATNVCLTNLEAKPRRPLPTGLGTADSAPSDELLEDHEVPWLEPIPDAAVEVAERDTIRLAFVAALQHLPARQRAVLILRDVLRWSAAETATALDTTTAAVNSALQRAHAQLAERGLSPDTVEPDLDAAQRTLLDAYLQAFWRKDIDQIVQLLKYDATWDMPPFLNHYRGPRRSADSSAPSAPAAPMTCRWSRRSPTGSRRSASTCASPRALRAVPPAGAADDRIRRRPAGRARDGVLRHPAVRAVRPAGAAAGRLRPGLTP
ncbi:RNA polymerase subunit sigma-70 [Nocardioides humi]|uniref:RNA polymerase subunit sigma-70 n=1 Tax=Nocardioides humi TaxID=449461 RepID=UPI001FE784D8|nr:RNA polymerase subunit sigma-70 [Nocardioides humi]